MAACDGVSLIGVDGLVYGVQPGPAQPVDQKLGKHALLARRARNRRHVEHQLTQALTVQKPARAVHPLLAFPLHFTLHRKGFRGLSDGLDRPLLALGNEAASPGLSDDGERLFIGRRSMPR